MVKSYIFSVTGQNIRFSLCARIRVSDPEPSSKTILLKAYKGIVSPSDFFVLSLVLNFGTIK